MTFTVTLLNELQPASLVTLLLNELNCFATLLPLKWQMMF